STGTGEVVAHYLEALPDNQPQVMYAATRAWADAHPQEIAAFRKSLEEASKIVNADATKARQGISGFTKIPMNVMETIKVSMSDSAITKEQLDWWVDVMDRQHMLQTKPDTAALVQK